jgi:hypothetical protein
MLRESLRLNGLEKQAGLVVEGASSGLDGGDRTRFVRFASCDAHQLSAQSREEGERCQKALERDPGSACNRWTCHGYVSLR